MRIVGIAMACAALALGGCTNFTQAFRGATPIDIWDARIAAADGDRLTRHAVALSDAQSLVGLPASSAVRPAIIWTPSTSQGRPCTTSRGAPSADPNCQTRWTYHLGTAPSDPKAGGTGTTTLMEPLTADVYGRLLVDHVRERVAQVDHLCLGYFNSLETLAGGSNFTRETIGVAANYGAILLALSESATKPLAILAGTRAALDGGLSAAETLLLLSPAPMQTYRLVKARQEKALAEARIDRFTRYTDAAAFIQSYAYACTPLGIRHIISDTIDDEVRRIDPAETSSAGNVILNQIVAAVKADKVAEAAYGAAPLATLTSDDAAYLSILLEHWSCRGDACPTSQELLFANAPAGLKPLLTAPSAAGPGQLKLSDQGRAQLTQLLGALAVVQPSFPTLREQTLTRVRRPPPPDPAVATRAALGQVHALLIADADARTAYAGAPPAALTLDDAVHLALVLDHWACVGTCAVSQLQLFTGAPAGIKALLTAPTSGTPGRLSLTDAGQAQVRAALTALAATVGDFDVRKQQALAGL